MEAMEKRAEVGTAHLRQSKDEVVAELAANFVRGSPRSRPAACPLTR